MLILVIVEFPPDVCIHPLIETSDSIALRGGPFFSSLTLRYSRPLQSEVVSPYLRWYRDFIAIHISNPSSLSLSQLCISLSLSLSVAVSLISIFKLSNQKWAKIHFSAHEGVSLTL